MGGEYGVTETVIDVDNPMHVERKRGRLDYASGETASADSSSLCSCHFLLVGAYGEE